MKKKIALFLASGMLFAAGCGGTLDTDAEHNTGIVGKQEETAGEKQEETVSADNGDRNMEENADSEQDMKTEDSSYTWQEITITLPKGWEDCCVIVDGESGFSIFQKASYEENNLSGFICGFDRTTELVEYGIGETMIAFTDDGLLYYLIQPLDVDCNTENEEIAGEYLRCANRYHG